MATKLKTHKATAKRFVVTQSKKKKHARKLLMRKVGQDHFNANKSGNNTRKKRRDVQYTSKKHLKNIARLMPYQS